MSFDNNNSFAEAGRYSETGRSSEAGRASESGRTSDACHTSDAVRSSESGHSQETVRSPEGLKLLVTVVNRVKSEYYADLIESLGANMQCFVAAEGTAASLLSSSWRLFARYFIFEAASCIMMVLALFQRAG